MAETHYQITARLTAVGASGQWNAAANSGKFEIGPMTR